VFVGLSPQFQPFVGVLILTVVFVMVASLIHKYRLWQAEKMRKAQRLLSGADRLEGIVQRLGAQALPQELGEFCHDELLARYRAVQGLYPADENVGKRIAAVETSNLGRGVGWDVPPVENEGVLNMHTAAMNGLVDFLTTETLHSSLDPELRRELRERIRVLRAETRFAYCERTSLEFAGNGDWDKAQNQMLRLMAFLREKAPPNERGKALYQKATDYYRHYNHRQMPGEESVEENVA